MQYIITIHGIQEPLLRKVISGTEHHTLTIIIIAVSNGALRIR